jgi:hypothetical protein
LAGPTLEAELPVVTVGGLLIAEQYGSKKREGVDYGGVRENVKKIINETLLKSLFTHHQKRNTRFVFARCFGGRVHDT